MDFHAGKDDAKTSGDRAEFANSKEVLLNWQSELSDEINGFDDELKNLLDKKNLLSIKINCFCKWDLSIYSQLKFKYGVEIEQTMKNIAKAEQKIAFLKELLKRVEIEIQSL